MESVASTVEFLNFYADNPSIVEKLSIKELQQIFMPYASVVFADATENEVFAIASAILRIMAHQAKVEPLDDETVHNVVNLFRGFFNSFKRAEE